MFDALFVGNHLLNGYLGIQLFGKWVPVDR